MFTRLKKSLLLSGIASAVLTSGIAATPSQQSGPQRSVEITVEFFDVPASIENPLFPDGQLQPSTPLGTDPSLQSGILALAGVFTEERVKLFLKDYRNNKDVDSVSSPPLFARSESRAIFKQVQEVRYATEYTEGKKPGDVMTPTKFETKEVGVNIEATPIVASDDTAIDLALSLRVCRLDGYMTLDGKETHFKNFGKLSNWFGPIPAEYPGGANIQPIFSSRAVTTQVTVYDGSTVILGGLKRRDEANGTDRNCFILVTARLVPSQLRE